MERCEDGGAAPRATPTATGRAPRVSDRCDTCDGGPATNPRGQCDGNFFLNWSKTSLLDATTKGVFDLTITGKTFMHTFSKALPRGFDSIPRAPDEGNR